MVRENRKVEAMPTCYCLIILCCYPLVFPFFSVIKILYYEHSFAFSPAMSVVPLSQERILRWSYLGLDQSSYHGWLRMMTSSEGPPFLVLPRAPPTLNPPLVITLSWSTHTHYKDTGSLIWLWSRCKFHGNCVLISAFQKSFLGFFISFISHRLGLQK